MKGRLSRALWLLVAFDVVALFTVFVLAFYGGQKASNAAGIFSSSGATTVTDILPAGLSFISGTGTGWSCSSSGQTVSCTNSGPIPPGAISPITLTVAVSGVAAPSVTNTATVSNAGDINAANNSASDSTAVHCDDSIAPSSRSFAETGGAGSVLVMAAGGCQWTATSNASFITITSGGSGSGVGTVNYTVAANSGPARNGTITIAGQTFTVSQDAGCTFSLDSASQSFTSSGGNGSVSVTTPAGCVWTATSNAGFITITSGNGGSGSGVVNYTVAANNGPGRNGTMTIAGQTFTVTQASNGQQNLNVALASNGATAMASSLYNASYPARQSCRDCRTRLRQALSSQVNTISH